MCLGLAFAGLTYSVFAVGLNAAWYADYPKSRFHLFNDLNEWMGMDKCGHAFSGYFQTDLVYQGARWAGMPKYRALLWGSAISTLFQTSIELMDGFQEQWGFSWADVGANCLGTVFFAGQQLLWNEQRITLKFSAAPQRYKDENINGENGGVSNLRDRAERLFGTQLPTRLLKDYNGQVYWLSFNPVHFSRSKASSWWPVFLNVALGYGAQNMYGGFDNKWNDKHDRYSAEHLPRYRQYFLSLDIDLRKVPVKNRFLKSALHVLNIFKLPAPALEYNSIGQIQWQWF